MNAYFWLTTILLNRQFKAYIKRMCKYLNKFGNNWIESFRLEHIFEISKNRGMFENSDIQLFES